MNTFFRECSFIIICLQNGGDPEKGYKGVRFGFVQENHQRKYLLHTCNFVNYNVLERVNEDLKMKTVM